jgi:hypothetical protein
LFNRWGLEHSEEKHKFKCKASDLLGLFAVMRHVCEVRFAGTHDLEINNKQTNEQTTTYTHTHIRTSSLLVGRFNNVIDPIHDLEITKTQATNKTNNKTNATKRRHTRP